MPKDSNDGLKTGQSVVLMDSNLRGRIIGLGKAKKTNMGPKRSTPMNPDGSLTIDLHIEAIPGGINVPKGQQLQFQMDTFR